MSFRLVPKPVTLNDLERRNGVILRYFSAISSPNEFLLLVVTGPTCNVEIFIRQILVASEFGNKET